MRGQVNTKARNIAGEEMTKQDLSVLLNNMEQFRWARLYEADTTTGKQRLQEAKKKIIKPEDLRISATLELRKLSSTLWSALNWGTSKALMLYVLLHADCSCYFLSITSPM